MDKGEQKAESIPSGALGENLACRFLASKGYKILERNYRKPWGEIDIVVLKRGIIHFVEVKTVSREPGIAGVGIDPGENLHAAKLKRLMRAIESYLMERGSNAWQLDAVLIVLNREEKRASVEFLENIGF